MNSKVKHKNDSSFNESKIPANVNTLRKLFENNFKLSNIANAFKLKHSKNSNAPKNTVLDGDSRCRAQKIDDWKENRECARTIGSPSDGSYLNCKIENCCCKTFFREYTETPNFRYRPLPKIPFQEHNNSDFNRCRPERWSASCTSYRRQQIENYEKIRPKSELGKNKFYSINYEFYKSKAQEIFDETPVSAVSTKRLEPAARTGRCVNLFEKLVDKGDGMAATTTRGCGNDVDVDNDDGNDDDNDDHRRRHHHHHHLRHHHRHRRTASTTATAIAGVAADQNVDALPARFEKTAASGFVNFTAASLNEGGYVKTAMDVGKSGRLTLGRRWKDECAAEAQPLVARRRNRDAARLMVVDEADATAVDASQELYRPIGFVFGKCRLPRLKNTALREQTHPYGVKKPRLTVKDVKNRNMRNVKRRQRLVDRSAVERSQTFGGYDNFAYRRSVTELHVARVGWPANGGREPSDETTATLVATASTTTGALTTTSTTSTVTLPPAENTKNALLTSGCRASVSAVVDDHDDGSVNGDDDDDDDYCDNDGTSRFRRGSRMTGYNWPVTSFYIERYGDEPTEGRRYSSSFDLTNGKQHASREKNANPVARKTNLKRHCSLGYLEEELFEYNFTRHRRSLDNVSKVSATCGIRNIPEVSNKIIKARKFQNLDIHVHALFAAVEHGYIEKTKTILESSEVDVNSVNSDGLSPLDVAVLSNNKPLVKLLVAYGAQEGRKFYSADDMRNHLYHLLHEAERRVQELGSTLRLNIESDQSSLSSSSSNIPSITIGDSAQNKTYSIWERRAKGLKRMLMGFEQIRPPDLPAVVTIEVTSTSSVMVYFTESDNKDSSITTKFRVQWSTDKEFSSLCGHYEVADTRQLRYLINNLRKGQSYYVRVASGNIKGYSAYKLSTPHFIVPSSWQDITEKDVRFSNSMRETLDGIFTNVVVTHPYLKSNVELYGQGGELLVNQRRKKASIKQLFTAASKFQKHLRRGVYLACLLYHEDKVLVTNEDFLPVIEVDENYPKKIHNDFHWFFKVAFSWNDLKWLKTDMEKSQNSSAVFRIKLLQAAVHMQTALSIQELGKLYHKMLRDVEGTIVISVINYIHSPKSVSVLNLRWMPLVKLTKRANLVNFAESNVADILMASIPDQITYHQVSKIKLPRGLYLSYLKMRSSVDSLQVLVPSRTPNMPPHCKVRDNPHVTAEEWEWLVKKENLRENLLTATYQQKLFIEQIVVTARRLFTLMEVPDEDAVNHRLYDAEVIEVNKDVSLIMVVPPAEAACSMPGQRELLLQRSDLLPLTVQVFEMVHFGTYQLDLISIYSRLSCIIEMDMDMAQHCLRKAFNALEVSTAKSKLSELETLHSQLNVAWKKSRWLLEVISFARDRLSMSPVTMRQLLTVHPKRTLPSIESHCYLQPPDPKTAKSRGSWPGVGVGRHLGRMPNEISRSEQHLTSECISVTTTTTQSSTKCTSAKATSSSERAFESESMNVVKRSPSADMSERMDCSHSTKYNPNAQSTSGNSSSGSTHSISSDELSISKVGSNDDAKDENEVRVPVPSPAVIKIYAAYNTGLDSPLHFKFHVSPKTTAREIVELFVKQTNMSIVLKGKEGPVYADDELSNFCLAAVIGARERCLRDDFRPVQLQQPWKDGRLYVRRKSNVLAAIECDSKQSSSSYV